MSQRAKIGTIITMGYEKGTAAAWQKRHGIPVLQKTIRGWEVKKRDVTLATLENFNDAMDFARAYYYYPCI